MRFLLVISCFVGFASAGVGKWTPEIELEALKIYKDICGKGDKGNVGDTAVFCKKPVDAPVKISRSHTVTVKGPESSSKQIIFVRPQSSLYKHTVVLKGTTENKQNTTIVVLPSKDQHQIDIKDSRKTTSKAEKPHLYYLSADPEAPNESETAADSDDNKPNQSPPPSSGSENSPDNAPPPGEEGYVYRRPSKSFSPPSETNSDPRVPQARTARHTGVGTQKSPAVIYVFPSYTATRNQGIVPSKLL